MKKRTKLEVIRDLLLVLKSKKNIRITPLIYKSNLSNNSIKPYIEELMEKELMEKNVVGKDVFFNITKKGFEFLEEFNKIKVFSDAYGL